MLGILRSDGTGTVAASAGRGGNDAGGGAAIWALPGGRNESHPAPEAPRQGVRKPQAGAPRLG